MIHIPFDCRLTKQTNMAMCIDQSRHYYLACSINELGIIGDFEVSTHCLDPSTINQYSAVTDHTFVDSVNLSSYDR